MMLDVISAIDVTKNFGSYKALQGVNLEIHSGECVGLLGPNGAGKSTFINIVYGACLRSGGSLNVLGLDPSQKPELIKKNLGVVPQENALDDELTVFENMKLYSKFVSLDQKSADKRINELLEYMSLDHKRNAPIRYLSGGMKRRLAFVRALLSDPKLLILDEPTTGLDPAVRHLLWKKVKDLRERGKTILITTHYMHEAEVLCNRIVILYQGKIVDQGSPRDLINKYTPGFVATYLGDDSTESIIRNSMPPGWAIYKQQDNWCLRAPNLNELVEFQSVHNLFPLQLRPTNLEDVYLILTGEELSQND